MALKEKKQALVLPKAAEAKAKAFKAKKAVLKGVQAQKSTHHPSSTLSRYLLQNFLIHNVQDQTLTEEDTRFWRQPKFKCLQKGTPIGEISLAAMPLGSSLTTGSITKKTENEDAVVPMEVLKTNKHQLSL